MPLTDEVLEFTQLIGPFYEFVDDRAPIKNDSVTSMKSKSNHTHLVNGTVGGRWDRFQSTQVNRSLLQMITVNIS